MRVLFEGDHLHVWAEFGAFTVHDDGERVEWRSAYHPRLSRARVVSLSDDSPFRNARGM